MTLLTRQFLNDFYSMGFGSPKVIFNTNGIKDMMPAIWTKTEKGYSATLKTLGIEKVNVEIEDCGIKVSGENEIDGRKYDTTINLPIAEDIMDNITEITHSTRAGLTFVNLILDRPEKKTIKITSDTKEVVK